MHLNLIFSLALVLPGTSSVVANGGHPPQEVQGCEAPIPWRIGAVDSRFGVTSEEVTDAIRSAAMLWGEALGGRLLFVESSAEGSGEMEVRFLFDERAEGARARRDQERALLAEASRIEESRVVLDSVRADLEMYREQQEEANRAYLAKMSDYNRVVAALNAAGGVSPDMSARLSEMASALDEEQRQIVVLTEEFNGLVAEANARTEALNSQVAAYNASRSSFQAEFGEAQIAPAAYHESRRELGPFTTSVTRSIEIYHFETRNDLLLLLAREMGRALGVPLSSIPGSVMSGTAPREGRPALHPSDVAAIRTLCPNR